MNRLLLIGTLLIPLFTLSAQAKTDAELVEEKHESSWGFFMRYSPDRLKDACGDIELVVDEENFKEAVKIEVAGDEDIRGVRWMCQPTVDTLAKYCEYDRKDMVRRQIKKVTCTFDKDVEQEVTLKDGTLSVTGGKKTEQKLDWAIGDLLIDDEYLNKKFSFRQADLIKYQEKQHLNTTRESYQSGCGEEIKFTVDWSTMVPQLNEALKDNATPGFYGFCKRPVSELTKICSYRKELVVKRVKAVNCAIGPERVYTLDDEGTMTISAPEKDEGLWNFIGIRTGELIKDDEGFNHRELEFIKHEEKQMDYDREAFKEKCDYELDAQIDWKSFQPVLKPMIDSTTYAVASECDGAVTMMADACQNEKRGKRNIKKKVKSFVCQYHDKKKTKASLVKKKFTFKTNLQEEDNSNLRKFFIKKRLAKKPKKMRKMTSAEVRRALYRSPGDQCRSKCTGRCGGGKGASKCRSRCKAACPK